MKIFVSAMPKEPKECLFAKKERLFDAMLDGRVIYQYYCTVNGKLCNLYCNGKCNKLRTLK